MKKLDKKRKIICAIILIFIYMIIGAIAPFIIKKQVSKEYKSDFNYEDFYGSQPGVDRAMLVKTNQMAWEERIRLLNKAKNKIIFVTYDLRDGESTKDTLAVLLKKANEGVKIKILVDGINSLIRMEGNEIFYALSSHSNVEIKQYNSLNILQPWKTQGRMHDKYIIVDDLAYILGGRNAFDYFIGEYGSNGKNIDREVLVYNGANGTSKSGESSIHQLESYFNEVWNLKYNKLFHDNEKIQEKPQINEKINFLQDRYVSLKHQWPELFSDYSYEKHTVETNKVKLISNETHIYGKEPRVFYSLVKLMEGAKERVKIHSPYAVLDDYMTKSLKGVSEKVRDFKFVINSVENGDNVVASSDYLRNKDKVIGTGAEIFEYDGGKSTHEKSIAIDDDIAIVGSFNFDMRSTYINTELMLVINSKELTKELKQLMTDVESQCRKVIDETNYEVPSQVNVKEVSFGKKFTWWILGIVIQPFRFLV